MTNQQQNNIGVGFIGLLTIALIVLKLTGYINWRWRWVIAPVWIMAIVSIIATGIVIIVAVIQDNRKIKYKSRWEELGAYFKERERSKES
jgi:hypothetical protein